VGITDARRLKGLYGKRSGISCRAAVVREGVKIHLPSEVTAFIRPSRGEMLGASDARALRKFVRGSRWSRAKT
jgi:hypothetical protein